MAEKTRKRDAGESIVSGANKPMRESGPISSSLGRPQKDDVHKPIGSIEDEAPKEGTPAARVEQAFVNLKRIAEGHHEGTVMDEYVHMCIDISILSSAPVAIGADSFIMDGCDDAIILMSNVMASRVLDGGDLEAHRRESMMLHTLIAKSLVLDAEGELPARTINRLEREYK